MWTMTFSIAFFTVAVLIAAYALHAWVGIRRAGATRAEAASTFGAWLKARWDWAIAALLALAPVVWSVGLDTIVIAANLLANIVPAIAGLDLSSLMLTDQHKVMIQAAALVVPPIRDAIEKMRSK